MERKLTMKELKKHYDTSITVSKPIPLNDKIIDYIISKKPHSVFEFGANWGVNLKAIQEASSIFCVGMDLSRVAVFEADRQGLHVIRGDERTLTRIRTEKHDIVFTVSVLNHIPDEFFVDIITQLKRIAKKEVILAESNEGQGERWFEHDYISQGFEIMDYIISEPYMIRFNYYRWVKK
jgi:hypothetical protein